MTLLHIHQCTSHGNMMPASQKRNFEGRKIIFVVESKNKKVFIFFTFMNFSLTFFGAKM